MNVHLDDISSAAEPFVTELGMMMYLSGLEYYYARRFVCCLQVQDHNEGSYNQV